MSLLNKDQVVNGYSIENVIKENEYTETYKVADENGNHYFLKLYILKRTPSKIIDENGEVLEIRLSRSIKQVNIVSYITDGVIDTELGECRYLVTNYFTGDVLSDKVLTNGPLSQEEALGIFRGILNGLKYLHDRGLSHNDITPANIMLSENLKGVPEIIDLGHVSRECRGKVSFEVSDLDVYYCANGTAAGIFDESSDLFSSVAVLYFMLTGKAPWNEVALPDAAFNVRMLKLKQQRKNTPVDLDGLKIGDNLKNILSKGLSPMSADAYHNVDEIIGDLDGHSTPRQGRRSERHGEQGHEPKQEGDKDDPTAIHIEVKKGGGNGFKDIAGMMDLKMALERSVIFVLKDKETAARYRLLPPNGMLLYGPPGCGKSFFAEKFAEETGFNFMFIKSSDLSSVYVHGSQEKISKLFKLAEEQAPMVMCFDEFDAFVPERTNGMNDNQAGEVNEFLTQLNNCSERGIFVIATSNRPDKIDPAVLRTGRIDKQVYVPLPDFEARKEMFRLHLQGRPMTDDIDFDELSKKSEGYIASDIAYIVNDAAMTAAFTRQPISQSILDKTLQCTRPSVRMEILRMYEGIKERMEGIERANIMPPIGFRKDK